MASTLAEARGEAKKRVEAREPHGSLPAKTLIRTAYVVRRAEGVEARERAPRRGGRGPFPPWRRVLLPVWNAGA